MLYSSLSARLSPLSVPTSNPQSQSSREAIPQQQQQPLRVPVLSPGPHPPTAQDNISAHLTAAFSSGPPPPVYSLALPGQVEEVGARAQALLPHRPMRFGESMPLRRLDSLREGFAPMPTAAASSASSVQHRTLFDALSTGERTREGPTQPHSGMAAAAAAAHKVWLGSLPSSITEAELRQHLSQFGSIQSLYYKPEQVPANAVADAGQQQQQQGKKMRGWAFVTYLQPAEARELIKAVDGVSPELFFRTASNTSFPSAPPLEARLANSAKYGSSNNNNMASSSVVEEKLPSREKVLDLAFNTPPKSSSAARASSLVPSPGADSGNNITSGSTSSLRCSSHPRSSTNNSSAYKGEKGGSAADQGQRLDILTHSENQTMYSSCNEPTAGSALDVSSRRPQHAFPDLVSSPTVRAHSTVAAFPVVAGAASTAVLLNSANESVHETPRNSTTSLSENAEQHQQQQRRPPLPPVPAAFSAGLPHEVCSSLPSAYNMAGTVCTNDAFAKSVQQSGTSGSDVGGGNITLSVDASSARMTMAGQQVPNNNSSPVVAAAGVTALSSAGAGSRSRAVGTRVYGGLHAAAFPPLTAAAAAGAREEGGSTGQQQQQHTPSLPALWEVYWTEDTKQPYYYNAVSKHVQWERPLPPKEYVDQFGSPMAAELGPPAPLIPGISRGVFSGKGGAVVGPPGSNLFVFHLPAEWSEETFLKHFTPFGNVVSCKIQVNVQTGKRGGFGFVSYDCPASAIASIRMLNGYAACGKMLKVQLKKGEEHLLPPDLQKQQQQQQQKQQQQVSHPAPVPPPFSFA